MVFSPKKDLVYGLVIWLAPVIVFTLLLSDFSILLSIVFIFSLLLSFWIWNSTEYRIESGELIIKCWILKKRVKILDIVTISRTRNIFSSYALSTDRLEIKTQKPGAFYIAPLKADSFIQTLKKENPAIVTKLV